MYIHSLEQSKKSTCSGMKYLSFIVNSACPLNYMTSSLQKSSIARTILGTPVWNYGFIGDAPSSCAQHNSLSKCLKLGKHKSVPSLFISFLTCPLNFQLYVIVPSALTQLLIHFSESCLKLLLKFWEPPKPRPYFWNLPI